MAQVTTDRDGMEFIGENGFNLLLGDGGKTLHSVMDFCDCMWGGPYKGDIAILHEGRYYVCDGVNPDTGKLLSEQELEELKGHFGESIIFLG